MRLSAPEIEELMAVAGAMADAARIATLRHFRRPDLDNVNKDTHGGFDPVTAADREAEAAMRAVLAARRPCDAIVGEEDAARPGTSGLTWVLDPVDGTRAFISGLPTWGVLIAVGGDRGPILGIVDQPFTEERFMGGPNGATLIKGGAAAPQPIHVRPCAALSEATLFTTFPEVGSTAERRGFEAVRDQVRLTRYGCDCYAYALLAMGQIDLVIEAGLNSYDIQGPMAVIEAAGGFVTDWRGGPAYHGGRILAAGDARIHQAALDVLSQVPG